MMVSDQPAIRMLDQNHAKSSPRFFRFAVSNRAEFIEPGRIGNVVVEHDDLAVADHDLVPAFCQSGKIVPDGFRPFLQSETRRSDENCVRRVETNQRIDVIRIKRRYPALDDCTRIVDRSCGREDRVNVTPKYDRAPIVVWDAFSRICGKGCQTTGRRGNSPRRRWPCLP